MTHDYGLYFVTDSTDALLRGRELANVVQKAIEGGVTIVQYRDKISNTKVLISTARRLHAITKSYGIPLLINDRIDVALAIGAEGVHIGQDDIDLKTARRLLGPKATIGVTCHNGMEAHQAVEGGADYLGIGTIFATQTKVDATNVIGTAGCRDILAYLATCNKYSTVPTVAIGGINESNVQRVLYQSRAAGKALEGVAVVSAILRAEQPEDAARTLRNLVNQPPPFHRYTPDVHSTKSVQGLLQAITGIARTVVQVAPLCHNMTNMVVQNFAANVVLAIGAKPIMSHDGNEAEDLASLGGSLVINMGTTNAHSLNNFLKALNAYNKQGGPVLLDPVGAGATRMRRQAVKDLLAGGYFDFMKGNENEIQTLWGTSMSQQRGVDSDNKLSLEQKAHLVKNLAARERNVVIMTGEADLISDGERTFLIRNGHPLLGTVTGTGCTLGATIASYAVVGKEDKLVAAVAGILHFEIAAERAARRTDVQGPGSFIPIFIDSLQGLASLAASGDSSWLAEARVAVMK